MAFKSVLDDWPQVDWTNDNWQNADWLKDDWRKDNWQNRTIGRKWIGRITIGQIVLSDWKIGRMTIGRMGRNWQYADWPKGTITNSSHSAIANRTFRLIVILPIVPFGQSLFCQSILSVNRLSANRPILPIALLGQLPF